MRSNKSADVNAFYVYLYLSHSLKTPEGDLRQKETHEPIFKFGHCAYECAIENCCLTKRSLRMVCQFLGCNSFLLVALLIFFAKAVS